MYGTVEYMVSSNTTSVGWNGCIYWHKSYFAIQCVSMAFVEHAIQQVAFDNQRVNVNLNPLFIAKWLYGESVECSSNMEG